MTSRRSPQVLTLAALALTALTQAPGHALADAAQGPVTGDVSGYLESRHHAFFGLDPDFADLSSLFPPGFHPDKTYGAVERLRPTLKLHIGESATLVSTVEAHADHGFFDRPQHAVGDVVGVERLYLTATVGDFDHTFGKQNIAWGSGLLLNPTDLFNDKNPADLQAERPGVLGLRSLYALDDHTNVTLVVATPTGSGTCCAPTLIGRFDTTVETTDLALELAWDDAKQAGILGADVRTEYVVGLWAEAALTVPAHDMRDALDHNTTSVEAGLDDSFDILQTLYVAGEYIFQQSGQSHPGDQLDLAHLQAAATSGGSAGASLSQSFAHRRMFAGRHYGVALVRLEIDHAWRAQVIDVTNAVDHTGLVVPQVSYMPADAFTFTLGAQIAYGPKGGEYTLSLPELTPQLETALPVVQPELGPALVALQGARLTPIASVFLWGRYAF